MEAIIYIAMLLPAILMVLAGLMISASRTDSIIKSHHFAKNFNIKKYTAKLMTLFTLSGIMFSVGGLVMIKISIIAGVILLAVTLTIFLIAFICLQKY